MPAPHHSGFYRPDALLAAQPTASQHWRPWFRTSVSELFQVWLKSGIDNVAYCCRRSVVYVSVCMLVGHIHEHYKMAELIEVPFGTWMLVGWSNHAVGAHCLGPLKKWALLGGAYLDMFWVVGSQHTQHTERYSQRGSMYLHAVDKLNIIRSVAAVMWPLAASTAAACLTSSLCDIVVAGHSCTSKHCSVI